MAAERERGGYVAFFLSWNQVATKGRENPNEAPPTRTKNSRTLFFVWNGMFCLFVCMCACVCGVCERERKEVVTLNNAHHDIRRVELTLPGTLSTSPLNGRALVRERRE